MPVVQFMHNTTPSPLLGGKTPSEVAFGATIRRPLQFALFKGKSIEDVDMNSFDPSTLAKEQADAVSSRLFQLHRDIVQRMQDRHARNRDGRPSSMPHFNVGDYVLVGKRVAPLSKLLLRWQGPYKIVSVPSQLVRGVLLLGKPPGEAFDSHVTRMRMFADHLLETTQDLTENAQHDEGKLEVEKIISHKFIDGVLHLRVRWMGFMPADDTHEPFEHLVTDASRSLKAIVSRYLKSQVRKHPRLRPFLQQLSPNPVPAAPRSRRRRRR